MEENKEKKERAGFPAQGRSVLIALIATIGAIICVSIFTGGLVNYKKSGGGSGITATGSASCDFESDLIVWRGSFRFMGTRQRMPMPLSKGCGTGKAVSGGKPGGGG